MGKIKLPIERDGIKPENPEKFYEFGDEIGRGKNSVVRQAVNKKSGQKFAAKIIKFDKDSIKFAIREYDLMAGDKMKHQALVQLHEAYLVRKYLILILELVDGKTLLDQVSHRHSLNEDDVAILIRQLCEVLANMHSNNIVHLDLRPTNMRLAGRELKLLDYNSARSVKNKKSGEVVDVIGDTEFAPPEMLNFDPVQPASDMWSVGVLMYILLSGISPFFHEDEDKVVLCVQKVQFEKFTQPAFGSVTSEAKDFISKVLIRAQEMRMTAEQALAHKWLSKDYEGARKRSVLKCQDVMAETDERLYSEEEEDYIEASLIFRTFEEEEYESPEEESEEEED